LSQTTLVRDETIPPIDPIFIGTANRIETNDDRFMQNDGTLARNDPNFTPGDDRFALEGAKSITREDRFIPDLGRFDEIDRNAIA
jgi:hypothetical protein